MINTCKILPFFKISRTYACKMAPFSWFRKFAPPIEKIPLFSRKWYEHGIRFSREWVGGWFGRETAWLPRSQHAALKHLLPNLDSLTRVLQRGKKLLGRHPVLNHRQLDCVYKLLRMKHCITGPRFALAVATIVTQPPPPPTHTHSGTIDVNHCCFVQPYTTSLDRIMAWLLFRVHCFF